MATQCNVLLPIDTDATASPELQEQQYVHDVYEQIAPHFSQTRYKVGRTPGRVCFPYVPKRLNPNRTNHRLEHLPSISSI